jgi:DNA-directed RNA polymerase alpha subunit
MNRITTRARNILICEKILSCEKLIEWDEKDISKIKGVGIKTVCETISVAALSDDPTFSESSSIEMEWV